MIYQLDLILISLLILSFLCLFLCAFFSYVAAIKKQKELDVAYKQLADVAADRNKIIHDVIDMPFPPDDSHEQCIKNLDDWKKHYENQLLNKDYEIDALKKKPAPIAAEPVDTKHYTQTIDALTREVDGLTKTIDDLWKENDKLKETAATSISLPKMQAVTNNDSALQEKDNTIKKLEKNLQDLNTEFTKMRKAKTVKTKPNKAFVSMPKVYFENLLDSISGAFLAKESGDETRKASSYEVLHHLWEKGTEKIHKRKKAKNEASRKKKK